MMNPTVEYEMSEADFQAILDASKPTMVIKIGDYTPAGPQENANRAWEALGRKMGFDHMTARPSNRGERWFTAVPNETDAQRDGRVAREIEAARLAEIATLKTEIAAKSARLAKLQGAVRS